MKKYKRLNIKKIIYEHLVNNSKEYLLVILIFLIGVFLGVMFINNIKEVQVSEITSYLNNFVDKLKTTENLENMKILKTSMLDNIILAIALWFFGTTVIGMPIVFGIVLYRGFCLGYTIASVITIMGIGKGLCFIFMALLLQNIIFIPSIIAIGVSGLKLYKSIIKDRNKDNVKIEILRHTIFSIIMLGFLCISSIIEILISTNFLKNFIKYF